MTTNTTTETFFPATLDDFAPAGLYAPAVRANTARSLKARKPPRFGPGERRLLATFTPSRGGKPWEVRLGADGVVWCSCPAWRNQALPPGERVCKHIAALFGLPWEHASRPRPHRSR